MKTLLVGLDAACWDYLNPLLDAGRLPVLSDLIGHGVWGTLQSTLPAITPPAWASIITGKNPGKHGLYDFLMPRPGTYDFAPLSARMRLGTPFWKYLNAHNVGVGLVNIPLTYPPDPLDGFVVCGFLTPSTAENVTYPPAALQWIEEHFGAYEPAVRETLDKSEMSPDRLFDIERSAQRRNVEIAPGLADLYQVDVLVINLMFLDQANHDMPEMGQVEEAICASDADLGRLIEGFHPDNVMLISDHGSRRVKGDVLLHAWLRDHGYSAPKERTPAERKASLNWVLVQWLQYQHGWNGLRERAIRGMLRETLNRLPDRVMARLWPVLGEVLPAAEEFVSSGDLPDYTRAQVFPPRTGNWSGVLYFNLAGREPTGVVAPDECDALLTELTERLVLIKDPDTGEPVISGVYGSADLYTGQASRYAPDVILDHFDGAWNVVTHAYPDYTRGRLRDRYFFEHPLTLGVHSRDGIFVFSGACFRAGSGPHDGHIMDVPATLLYLYDVPIPEDFDGRVLKEAFTSQVADERPIRYQPGDDPTSMTREGFDSWDEAEELMDRLRALGYL